MGLKAGKNFDQEQKEHYDAVEEKQFFWLTQNPYIVEVEKKIISKIISSNPKKILEVGCGEGANIFILKKLKFKGEIVGIDYSDKKISFAKSQIPNAKFLAANAYRLPFKDGQFDLVFCKNILHHLSGKKKVIAEMSRVCKKGGEIVVVEGNGKNLIMFLFGHLVKHEVGILDSKIEKLTALIEKEKSIMIENVLMEEPIVFWRALVHYSYGLSNLAGWGTSFFFVITKLLLPFIPLERYGNIIIKSRKI